MLEITDEILEKFSDLKIRYLEKTVLPKENNWIQKTTNELWFNVIAQVMVVGNSKPFDTFMERLDLQEKISYDSLLKLKTNEEILRQINFVLLAVGTRYASRTLTKSIKAKSLLWNFNKFRKYNNGVTGFLQEITNLSSDIQKIKRLMSELKYIKTKGARDLLMELGIVKNAIAFDVRVINILQKIGVNLPDNFTANPRLYSKIEKEILDKICEPLGISGVMFDRMLYQNYNKILCN